LKAVVITKSVITAAYWKDILNFNLRVMLKLCTERKKERKKALKYLFVQRPTIPLWLTSSKIKEVLSAEGEVEKAKDS
jgi:hypothetical protein